MVPPQVLARFSRKILPEPEEVPKKQSLEVKILPKPEEVPKRPKKPKGPGDPQNFGFFGTCSDFGKVFKKNMPEPEEVPKKPKSRGENLAKT